MNLHTLRFLPPVVTGRLYGNLHIARTHLYIARLSSGFHRFPPAAFVLPAYGVAIPSPRPSVLTPAPAIAEVNRTVGMA